MNRHALRSVYSQARPELQQTGQALKNYFQQFSTSHVLAADNDGSPPTPSNPNADRGGHVRTRTRAATSEISSLARGRGNFLGGGRGGGRGGRGGWSGGHSTQSADGASTGPNVIDVRSLPRGGLSRGRGGLRGRGALTGSPRGGGFSASPTGENRFSGLGRGSLSGDGRGGRGFRGARGGRGRGVRGDGRGGRGRGGKRPDGKPAEKENTGGFKKQDPFELMDGPERAFDNDIRFGTRAPYSPSLSRGSLSQHMPSIPCTPEGRIATIMQNLSFLGTADPVGVSPGLMPAAPAEDLEKNGIRFFADVQEVEAAEQHLQEKKRQAEAAQGGEAPTGPEKGEERIIYAAEEAIRKVITEQAIEGKHEAPKYATDPMGVARSLLVHSETYTKANVEKLQKKLSSVIGRATGGKKAEPKPAAKAQPKAAAKA